MLEKEAKTKWCPHVRAVPNAPNYAAGNRFDGSQPLIYQCRCIASDCMMWEPEYINEDKEINHSDDIPEGWHQVGSIRGGKVYVRRYVKTDKGDCGLITKACEGCNV